MQVSKVRPRVESFRMCLSYPGPIGSFLCLSSSLESRRSFRESSRVQSSRRHKADFANLERVKYLRSNCGSGRGEAASDAMMIYAREWDTRSRSVYEAFTNVNPDGVSLLALVYIREKWRIYKEKLLSKWWWIRYSNIIDVRLENIIKKKINII